MNGGPYDALIRSWTKEFASWEEYNAEADEEMRFDPSTTPLTRAPRMVDNRGQGVVDDLTYRDEPVQIIFLPADIDLTGRWVPEDKAVRCDILACGRNWEPPIVRLTHANLQEAKSMFVYRPMSLTAALHDVRAHR